MPGLPVNFTFATQFQYAYPQADLIFSSKNLQPSLGE